VDWIIRLAGQIASGGNASNGSATDSNFVGGITVGILIMLTGIAAKYFFDYRVAKRQADMDQKRVELETKKNELEGDLASRKLLLEERNATSSIIGATQANFVRSCAELYDRLSNFCDNQDYTSPWMKPQHSPIEDGYYLTEFVRRIFSFIAWGRIAQDAVNSLPVEVTKERPDLQRVYTFVNLANSLLTFTWLFKGMDKYPDTSEGPHLFTGSLGQISELGVRLWKDHSNDLPREQFIKLYRSSDESLMQVRYVLTRVYVEKGSGDEYSRNVSAIVVARLAALRAVLAAYLSKDHSWALALSNEYSILERLRSDLAAAESIPEEDLQIPMLVKENLDELIERYRCEWLNLS
jgi:hypothetical protein